MGRGKINFFDVLDKYECWKGKCAKSVLGEFSFSVSIYSKKGPQSDLGAFLTAHPTGGYGVPSSGSAQQLAPVMIVTRSDKREKKRLRCIRDLQKTLKNPCFRKQESTLANFMLCYQKIFVPIKFCH